MNPLTPTFLAEKHAAGSDYQTYVASDPNRAPQWQAIYERLTLTDEQQQLLASFTRTMPVICLSGTWCGDCVAQGPMFERIAEASDAIDLRWLDRNAQQVGNRPVDRLHLRVARVEVAAVAGAIFGVAILAHQGRAAAVGVVGARMLKIVDLGRRGSRAGLQRIPPRRVWTATREQ